MSRTKASKDRPRRLTRERYEQTADWLEHWPRRWFLFGPRVMPVALYLERQAFTNHAKDKIANVLRGKVNNLEATLSKRARLTKKTQDYIQQQRGRLDQAALDGLTVAAFLEQDHEKAREHWHGGPDA